MKPPQGSPTFAGDLIPGPTAYQGWQEDTRHANGPGAALSSAALFSSPSALGGEEGMQALRPCFAVLALQVLCATPIQ